MKTIAEFILPGHPDKICDRIADLIVDAACTRDPRSLVGVEVALHRYHLLITGCVTTSPPMTTNEITTLVHKAFFDAGYSKEWSPHPEELSIEFDLRLEELDDDLRNLRSLSDDQAICIGYANSDTKNNHLPFAHRVCYLAGQKIKELREEFQLGPDAKVIVTCQDDTVERISLSLQHKPVTSKKKLYQLAHGVAQSVGVTDSNRVFVNGGGDFDVGGPHGDNGLSGKKLVVDAYGPTVPIGGGAWSGKDPHKVDRAGSLIARYIALQAIRMSICQWAKVEIGWHPGDRSPSYVHITSNRGIIPIEQIGNFDLSIDGINRILDLSNVRFADYADGSWFQKDLFSPKPINIKTQHDHI